MTRAAIVLVLVGGCATAQSARVLPRGRTTSLVGESGSGKSTLVAILAGLMLPDSGSISFDGADVTSVDDASRARLRAQRIGVVLQGSNLIAFLTAAENVELAMRLARGERRRPRAAVLVRPVIHPYP